MNQRVKTVFEQAQKLNPDEREQLAELLMATIETNSEIDAAWIAEIEDRIAAGDRGEAHFVSAEEVLAKLRRP